MEQKIMWRFRFTPLSPMELVVELLQEGETLIYRRLFEGDVVKETPITWEKAKRLLDLLLEGDWHLV